MIEPRATTPFRLVLFAGLFFASGGAALAAPDLYVRGAVGHEESGGTTVRDLDCASTDPPALFGCAVGPDGRSIGARGDFGDSVALELALGTELGRRARVELALSSRLGLGLDAEANFLGVDAEQPVRAETSSLAAFAVVAVDLGRPEWRLQPYLAAGAGAARNEVEDGIYAFPGVSPDATTIVRGGDHTDFAWTAAAGLSYRLTESTFLELAARYTDLGEVRTDPGEATIVRPRGTFTLDIAGTRADLDTAGVTLGLRWAL